MTNTRDLHAASEGLGRPTYLDAIMYLAFEDDVVPGLGEDALAAYAPVRLVAALWNRLERLVAEDVAALYLSGAPS